MDGVPFHLRNPFGYPGYPGVVPGVPNGVLPNGLQQGLNLQVPDFTLPSLSTADIRCLNRADANAQQPVHTTVREYTAQPPGTQRVSGVNRCVHPGCSKQFAWPQDLSKHVRKEHSGEPPKFRCQQDGCGKSFFERKLLTAHERTHTGERPFLCPHEGCESKFKARNALAYHIKALHGDESEILKCNEPGCTYSTRKKAALTTHEQRHRERATEAAWKDKAKGEVRVAVQVAKDVLKEKKGSLTEIKKELKNLKRERKEVFIETEKLEVKIKKLKKKVNGQVAERVRMKAGKRKRKIGEVVGGEGA